MYENFEYYLKSYSPIFPENPLSREKKERISEILPGSLVEFITKYGFVSFHGGLFNLCDPDEFRSILALIFKADKEFHHRSCHVVGFTAFGTLWCWSDQYLDFKIDLPFSFVYCDSLTMPGWKPTASADHIASGIVPDREDADFLDNAGEPMFDRCVAAYGRPSSTECFGFVPALAIAGAFGPLQRVENIKRMSALEHFTILAQLEQFHLVVPGPDDIIPVRAIG